MELRILMTKWYVLFVPHNGYESWTLDPDTEKKINAFQVDLYRRLHVYRGCKE